jgi:hypothetical protein
LVEHFDNNLRRRARRSVGHAHTGQFATLAGIAAISLAENSKAARQSAQGEFSPARG